MIVSASQSADDLGDGQDVARVHRQASQAGTNPALRAQEENGDGEQDAPVGAARALRIGSR